MNRGTSSVLVGLLLVVGCTADDVATTGGTSGPSAADADEGADAEGNTSAGEDSGSTAVDSNPGETTAPPAEDSTTTDGFNDDGSTTSIEFTSSTSEGSADSGIVYEGECPDEDIGSTVPQSISDTTVGADNTLFGSCGGHTAGDFAYLFTAPATGLYTFQTENSDYNTVLYLLEDCDGLEQLQCNDDSGGADTSRIDRDLTQDDQVVVVVDGEDGAEGNFELVIELDVCPDEDLGSTVPQSVVGSTSLEMDTSTGSCMFGASNDYAYTFTAPHTGTFVFDTAGSSFDTGLYIFDGATCSGTELACNDDAIGLQSEIVIDLVEDQEITIVVDGYNGASGDFDLNIMAPICGNDTLEDFEECDGTDFGTVTCVDFGHAGGDLDCDDECNIDDSGCDPYVCPEDDLGNTVPNMVSGDTSAAYNHNSGSCVGSGAPDYTYLFTAPHTGTFVFDTFGSLYDTGLYVLDGNGCDGTELACNDDTGGLQSQVVVDLVQDQEVTVVVDGYSSNSGSYDLNVIAPVCGNDSLDPFEDCDGDDLGGETCVGLGYPGGVLACDAACNFDESGCSSCDDDIVNGGDVCDGTALAATRCEDLGYDGGSLDCADDCSLFDESECADGIIAVCSAPGLAITDLSTTSDTIMVADSGTIADVDVFVDITHTYAGDLEITLNAEDLAVTDQFTDDDCPGPNDVWAFFNDEGNGPPDGACVEPYAIEGNVVPDNPLSVFDGLEAMGSWTLEVYDDAGADQGTLNEWCIYITLAP